MGLRMASFRKMKSGWRAEVCVNRVRDSRMFDTKSAAMIWAVEREQEIKEGKEEVCKHIGTDIFNRYLKEVSKHKRGEKWEKIRLLKFIEHPPFKKPVNEIVSDDIVKWRNLRLTDVSPSTVRREMNLLGHCFETARKEWKWIDENPCADVRKPSDAPPRDRLISEEEIKLIRQCLDWPKDEEATGKMQKVAVGFCFAIETAMRMGEICGLTKKDINKNVAKLPKTKNGSSREVPLSKRALELLTFVPDLWEDMTPKQFEALYRKGRDRSGIENLVFHDTRHEAITRLAKKLDVLDLARMVGHKDIRQLMTYYNETAENLASRLD